ncbi:putative WEB family protein, chloroplastic [Glycine soja]|uniref:Putative WEB family protein, chloroplastic n=1 Tax=Glycine soja TaxID=3848 RepID=A0A445F0T3_GLYSO|nr:putative WEB family protein, chloroplastic [Glycine soja]
MDSLLSTTQELQRVKQQLALTCYAKNQALNHADDATKIVEILAEKAEFLSSELMRLKALLDSKVETEARQNQLILKLKTDIEALKEELEKSKGYDDKLSERESFIELLNVELVASKMDESYARTLLEEWHTKVEELEMRIEEANKLEIYASEYLESIMKRVEGNNDLLHEAESEVDTLKEKVELLEMTIGRQRADVEDSQCQLCKAKEESLEKSKEVEALTSELERVKEEKAQALNDSMLDEARYEINVLVCIIENSKSAFENSKAEWEQRELQLVSCIKKNEEEKVSLEKEIKRLLYLLKETEEEANANREEEA